MSSVYEESFDIEGGDFTRAGAVASRVKKILKEVGLDNLRIKRAVIIAYEAEINVVSYAHKGRLTLSVSPEFIRILLEDEGPGIANIELAMQEGYSTATEYIRNMGFGAGMGLPNIKKKRRRDENRLPSERGYEGLCRNRPGRIEGSDMIIREVVDALDLEIKSGKEHLDREVTGGYVSDLLSDVMANSPGRGPLGDPSGPQQTSSR